jgi:hypothetical protein
MIDVICTKLFTVAYLYFYIFIKKNINNYLYNLLLDIIYKYLIIDKLSNKG